MPSGVLRTPLGITLLLGSMTFVVVAGLRLMSDVFAPILLAYTIAIALLPMVRRLEKRGLPRPLALGCVFLSAFVVASLLVGFFMLELQHFSRRIPSYQVMLQSRFDQLEALARHHGITLSDLVASSQVVPANLTKAAIGLISRLLGATASIVLFLFILLTMSLDFPGISRSYYAHKGSLTGPMRGLFGEIQTHFRLQTVSNLISAAAVTAAYLIFRIDFALLWGLSTFLLSYIPRVGMLLSFLPPVLMATVQYGLERGLALLIVTIVLNGLMDNVITPMITKKGLALRATTVLVTSLLWMWLFGPLGALLAMPLTLFVRNLLEGDERTMPLAYAMSTEDYEPSVVQMPAEGS